MAEQDEAFLQAVREAVNQALAELRPMPTPSPVTEIIVRVGGAGDVALLGGGGAPQPLTCCTRARVPNLEFLPFSEQDQQAIQRIVTATGVETADVHDELLARVLGREAQAFTIEGQPTDADALKQRRTRGGPTG